MNNDYRTLFRRASLDRRRTLGTWGCYQYLPHKEPHCYNDFRGFSHVRDGYLRFPKHLQLDQYQLREIGERRAGNAKHPKTDLRLNQMQIDWRPWYAFLQKNFETDTISYLSYFRESQCGVYCVHIQLNLDRFDYVGNLSALSDIAKKVGEF